MRQRNDSGYALNSPDVGRVIPPDEEFDHPDYITGCTNLDAPAAEPPAGGDGGQGGAGGTPAGQPETGDSAASPAQTTRNKAAGSEETPAP